MGRGLGSSRALSAPGTRRIWEGRRAVQGVGAPPPPAATAPTAPTPAPRAGGFEGGSGRARAASVRGATRGRSLPDRRPRPRIVAPSSPPRPDAPARVLRAGGTWRLRARGRRGARTGGARRRLARRGARACGRGRRRAPRVAPRRRRRPRSPRRSPAARRPAPGWASPRRRAPAAQSVTSVPPASAWSTVQASSSEGASERPAA